MRYGYPLERIPKPWQLPAIWAIAGAVAGVVLGLTLGLDAFAIGTATLLVGATLGVVAAVQAGQFDADGHDSASSMERPMDSRAAGMEPAIHKEFGDRFQTMLSERQADARSRQR